MRQRALAGTATFLAVFYALNLAFGALLELPKKELIRLGYFHPQRRWQDFYGLPPDSIDLVFLGSSHCYRSFDPALFDTELGTRSFNMGSPNQTALTSYYVLQEVLNSQHPRVVVVETLWVLFDRSDQFANATYNLEFMRTDAVRRQLRSAAYSLKDWVEIFFPAYRYRDSVRDLVRLARGKGIDVEVQEIYRDRGYVEKNKEEGVDLAVHHFSKADFIHDPTNRNVRYLEKIADLCRREGIRLILVMAPISPATLQSVTNYSGIHDYFQNFATRKGIEYYDYNLGQTSVVPFTTEDFFDIHHLNRLGVRKISTDLAAKIGRGAGDRLGVPAMRMKDAEPSTSKGQ